jgi:hypothetical protein
MPTKPRFATLIVGVWLLGLVLVPLTLFTPLEFTPLWLGNLPRWGLWGLAFPACHWLRVRTKCRLWAAVPWVLWAPLAYAVGDNGWRSYRDAAQSHAPMRWSTLVQPLELTFANDKRWWRQQVLSQNGARVTSLEMDVSRYGSEGIRYTEIFQLLPGLQWARRRELTEKEAELYAHQ